MIVHEQSRRQQQQRTTGRRVNFEWWSPLFFIETHFECDRWEMLCDYSNYYYYYYYYCCCCCCYYRYYCSSDFLRCWLVFAEEWWWWCTEKDKFWIYLQWYSPSDTLNLMEKHIAIIFEFYKKDVLLFVKWMAPQHEWISYIRDGVHPPSIQLLISFPPIIFLFY